jgi:hypothetical protein
LDQAARNAGGESVILKEINLIYCINGQNGFLQLSEGEFRRKPITEQVVSNKKTVQR